MSDSTEKKNEKEKEVEQEEQEESSREALMEWVRDIAVAIVIAVLVSLVVKPTIVKESSMEPNFYANDYIFLNRLSYKLGSGPAKGDVIVFKSDSKELLDKNGKNKLLIKRVIGVPGDKIKITGGEVYINGEKDEQDYTKDGDTPGDVAETEVPDGKLFCMGDNRRVSVDSRSKEVGFVDQDSIVGKAMFRLLPLGRIGTIKSVY